jgi:hypothetical protein
LKAKDDNDGNAKMINQADEIVGTKERKGVKKNERSDQNSPMPLDS